MKSKFFYTISVIILLYSIYVLYDYNLLFKDARNDFGNILQIFLPLLSVSFASIIFGIGCLLKNKK